MPQVRAAEKSDGSYDFNNNYDCVREIMSKADICMVNFECTFPGSNYQGYPAFRTPDSMASALKNAGVDVGIFANNHMNDSGLEGAKRTCQVIEDAGMQVVGCRQSESENRSLVYQLVKDGEIINVGVVAYTYETSRNDSERTMNGGYMRSDAVNYYNSFRQYADRSYLDKDIENIKNEIRWCQDRSDLTIVYLHWGEEYQRHSNKTQQYIAKELASLNPDAIVASHPHVVEEISYVNDVPVYYSIGNYISNQRAETLDNHYTEQGLIATLDFTLTKSAVDDGYYVLSGNNVLGTPEEVEAEESYNKKLFKMFSKAPEKAEMNWMSWSNWSKLDSKATAVCTWVNKYNSNGNLVYQIVPLVDGFESNEGLQKAGCVNRAKNALTELTDLLGEEFIRHTY